MRLYEGQKRNGRERCIADADIRYSTCPEALAIWDPEGAELDEVQHQVVRTVDGCFIRFADEEYIGLYEKFLEITYDDGGAESRDLEQRRAVVRSCFLQEYHFGEPEIKKIYSMFTTGDVRADLVGGCVEITIQIDSEDRVKLSDVIAQLRRWIPAHLGIFQTTIRVYEVPDLPLPFGLRIDSQHTTCLPEADKSWDYERGDTVFSLSAGFYSVDVLPEAEKSWDYERGGVDVTPGIGMVGIDYLSDLTEMG